MKSDKTQPQTKQIAYRPLFLGTDLQKKVDNRRNITWRKFFIFLLLLVLLHVIAIIDMIFNLRLPLVYLVPIYLFISCITAYVVDINKINKHAREKIQMQLTARTCFNFDLNSIWGNTKKAELAKNLIKLFIEWFNWNDDSIFLPDDSLILMTTQEEWSVINFIEKLNEKYSIDMIYYFYKKDGFKNLKFIDIINYIYIESYTPKVKRKRLKGIASGLASKFTSRNNNINGYWALGILYKITNDSGKNTFKLDILSADSDPPWKGSKKLTVKYKNFLIEQLEKNGFKRIHISEAVIEIDFNVSIPLNNKIKECTWGEAYCCRAIITDYLSKTYSYESYGYCGIHDPKKEMKSSVPG